MAETMSAEEVDADEMKHRRALETDCEELLAEAFHRGYARGVSDSAKVADHEAGLMVGVFSHSAGYDGVAKRIAADIRRLIPNQEGESNG